MPVKPLGAILVEVLSSNGQTAKCRVLRLTDPSALLPLQGIAVEEFPETLVPGPAGASVEGMISEPLQQFAHSIGQIFNPQASKPIEPNAIVYAETERVLRLADSMNLAFTFPEAILGIETEEVVQPSGA